MATLPPATTISSSHLDEAVSRLAFCSGEALSLRNLQKQRLPISHSKQNAVFSLCERASSWKISATAASAPQKKMSFGALEGGEEVCYEESVQEEATEGSLFDWNAQWYPVSMIDDLDKRVPTAITIMGRHLVVWWDKTRQLWRVCDEKGPEMSASLSDVQTNGRRGSQSSPSNGSLESSSQNAFSSVYPSVEKDGLLWLWPDSRPEFQNIAARKPPPSIPALTDPAFKDKLHSMNLPYGYKKMIENILEPAYLPFAHDEPQEDFLEDFEKRLTSTASHSSSRPSMALAYKAEQNQHVLSNTNGRALNKVEALKGGSVSLVQSTEVGLQSGEVSSQNLLGDSGKEDLIRDSLEPASGISATRDEVSVRRVRSSVMLKKPATLLRTTFEEKVSETDPSSNFSLSSDEDVISNGSSVRPLDLTSSLLILRRLIFRKDFELARARVKELYKKYPRDTDVLMEYAFVEKQHGDLVAAGSLYSQAISAFEDQQNLGYDYVRALQALGSIEACARNARRARVLFMESIRAARQAEQLLPDLISGASVYGLHAWARLEEQQGNWAKARDLLARAAEIQPGNAVVHQSRALLEAKAHNWGAARHHFSLAVESAPEDIKCWHAWAIFEASQGKKKKMRDLFQKALDLDPCSVHCLQAWAHQETLIGTPESKDKARSLFQRCTQIEPKSLYAWQAWAVLEKTSGKYDKARELFEKCLEINSSSTPCLQAYANMERHLENWGAAQRLLRKALKLEPENAAVLMEAAFVENTLGNSEVAERLFVLAGMADKRKSKVTNRIFASRKEVMPSKAGKGWRGFAKIDRKPTSIERQSDPIKAEIDAMKFKQEEANSNSSVERQSEPIKVAKRDRKPTSIERQSDPIKAGIDAMKIKQEEVNSNSSIERQSEPIKVARDVVKIRREEFISNSITERQSSPLLKQEDSNHQAIFQGVADASEVKQRERKKNADVERQPFSHLKQKFAKSTTFKAAIDVGRRPSVQLKPASTDFQAAINAIKARKKELSIYLRYGGNKSSPNFQVAIEAIDTKLRDFTSDAMDTKGQLPFPKPAERAPSMLGA